MAAMKRVVMNLSKTVSLSLFAVLLGSSLCLAQTPAPAAAGDPAQKAISDTDKKAISKACSDEANTKGLKGKERRKFRNACKKNGGKPA